jgi:DNA-binding LacI/PurR family transcriptional regulator
MTTIKHVAKACGVSVATVSGVLNNTPDAAGPETRARVLDMIRQMNYSPNAVARGLSSRRMDTIGVVMDYSGWGSLVADQHLGPIIDGVIGQCSRLRQKMLLYTESWSDAIAKLPSFCDGFCDGLLLIVPMVSDDFFGELGRRRTPFVIIGDYRSEPDLSAVDVDNVDAGRQLTNHLLDLGHKRIAMLRGEETHQSSWLRAQGYRNALEERGRRYEVALDIRGGYNAEAGRACALKLLEMPPSQRPTAIFCGDDRIALGVLEVLKERGINVPGEMSVVGINDSQEAAQGHPALTTLRQPGRAIGERAVDMVRAQIVKKEGEGSKIALPGTVVIRETSGPPPADS